MEELVERLVRWGIHPENLVTQPVHQRLQPRLYRASLINMYIHFRKFNFLEDTTNEKIQ